ncbi:MAG: asparagine synthase (glutamine-hydrolyzing) [Thermodesulfobacteriota bacterium]
MCGLFGYWLRRPLTDDDILRGREATGTLSHRGPDGQGEWLDRGRGLYLGHRRLAILDLSAASDQPMQREGLVVAFNGEIYNFKELRAELEVIGSVFRTTGDTEVLLAAWQRWGRGCLDRFDGMFAFALFDGERLHLVTDPFGEKPLFVVESGEGVFFASEAAVLVRLLGLAFEPTSDQVAQFLALGFIPAPETGFPGLQWLGQATLRSYDRSHQRLEAKYWAIPQGDGTEGKLHLDEADLDALAAILVRLLQRRLRADVPVGLFLSSGVDSALIGALAVRELGVALDAMTVSFSDGSDEADAASAVASALGLPHQVIDSRSDGAWREMPVALDSLYGVPNDNVTALSVFQMSSLARQRMIVALGGVGGDEAFYGYNKYEFLHRHRLVYRVPSFCWAFLRPLRLVPRLFPRLTTLDRLLSGGAAARFLALKNAELGELLRMGAIRVPPLPDFAGCGRDLLEAVRGFDLRQTLPASYIAAVDRGSMRASVEVRTPYLARDLFEFVAGFAPSAFFLGGQKIVLRRLLRRYLPPVLIDRPKQGFVFPLKRYLATVGDSPPRTSGLSPEALSGIWARRLGKGGDTLALRLLILEHFFAAHGATSSFSAASPLRPAPAAKQVMI